MKSVEIEEFTKDFLNEYSKSQVEESEEEIENSRLRTKTPSRIHDLHRDSRLKPKIQEDSEETEEDLNKKKSSGE